MTVWLVFLTLFLCIALSIAAGTSLGRYGDREDEFQYRHQMDEAMHQFDERLRRLEPDPPEPEEPQ